MHLDYSSLRKGFMWDWRPSGYFLPKPRLQKLLATVKGAHRRSLIECLALEGDLDALPAEFAAESLPEELRAAAGRFHPMLMGGEYLPDLLPNETEIARVELQSVTNDVISVRARPSGARISYRIVDEHDMIYDCHPRTSTRALTLDQLVRLMDGCSDPEGGVVLGYIALSAGLGTSAEDLRGFATVRSAFYPELGDWYRRASNARLDAYQAVR